MASQFLEYMWWQLGQSVFAVGNTDGCGANIEVAMLVVAALGLVGIEVELDVNGIWGKEVVVVVCVGQNVKLTETVAPLL